MPSHGRQRGVTPVIIKFQEQPSVSFLCLLAGCCAGSRAVRLNSIHPGNRMGASQVSVYATVNNNCVLKKNNLLISFDYMKCSMLLLLLCLPYQKSLNSICLHLDKEQVTDGP